MFRCALGLTALVLTLVSVSLADITTSKAIAPEDEKAPPRIQLAILLDTSNSMDGLINQARTQLWKIVNELATTERKGCVPHLDVALYEYGNDSLSAESLHIRQAICFTDDLDRVSEELFGLTTNGGQEYCGAVIGKAIDKLEWSPSGDDLKMIVIAGNEPFSQGPIDFHGSCSESISKGITITTIFCGKEQVGIDTGWKEGAELAEGEYLFIDQNEPIVTIPTPYDDKLSKLSIQINNTFLFYGDQKAAREAAERQSAQDTNAESAAPAAAAERALFKSSPQYQRASRDLIDALAAGSVKLEDLKPEELPTELRKLSRDDQKKLIKERSEERKRIQKEIRALTLQRQEFLTKATETTGAESKNTLDTAVLDAVRKQAERKEFTSPGTE
ncbi:MAG: hypothetical protein KDA93_09220 [Planctomycetaceae bacterium]|nr:hypothetical protein [Planctomycetaceae bacterium]